MMRGGTVMGKPFAVENPSARRTDPERVPLTDEQEFDMEAVGWAYGKCVSFGLENGSMESAMMMDRLKLMLEHGITGDAK